MFPKDQQKTALIYQDQTITYSELLKNITAFATTFKIIPGERVVVFSQNCPGWIYAFFSIWYQRGIAVALDVSMTVDDLTYIIQDSQPRVIFCSRQEQDRVKQALQKSGLQSLVLVIDQLLQDTALFENISPQEKNVTDPNETAVILYTSGTTGRPKGVMLSYDNFQANLEAVLKLQLLGKEDMELSLLPFHHIFPLLANVLVPLHIGTTIVIVTSLDKDVILGSMQNHHVTVMVGVPRLYERFHAGIMTQINAKPIARFFFRVAQWVNRRGFSQKLFHQVHASFGGHVRLYVSGGAKLDPQVARDLWTLGFTILEGYGTTETAPLIAANPFERIKLGTVGRPVAGCEVKLVDGEILVKGRNVMQGYYQKPAETQKVLRNGWYHTGDFGEIDADGYLKIIGRKDELIVLPNGKNISPEEIENSLQATSPLVKEVAVLLNERQLMALVYPDFSLLESQDPEAALESVKWQIINPYNAAVPNHKKILKVMLVQEPFPRTRLGKLRRFLLKDLVANNKQVVKSYAEPKDSTYALLSRFLKQLKGTTIYPFSHLEMDLGLDSLDFVELLAFIESSFGLRLQKADLDQHAAVSQLAEIVRQGKTRVQTEGIDWKRILADAQIKISPKKKDRIYLARFIRYCLQHYFRITVQGLEQIPATPCILAANHLSYLDAPLIVSVLSDEVLVNSYFVMKEKPILNALVRFISNNQVVMVNTEKDIKDVLQKSAAYLKAGKNLLIFPEGTRSRDGKMGTFKKSFAILSRELQVPIVPIAIQGTYQALPHGSCLPRRGDLSVHFEKPIFPQQDDYLSLTHKVAEAIRKHVEPADTD